MFFWIPNPNPSSFLSLYVFNWNPNRRNSQIITTEQTLFINSIDFLHKFINDIVKTASQGEIRSSQVSNKLVLICALQVSLPVSHNGSFSERRNQRNQRHRNIGIARRNEEKTKIPIMSPPNWVLFTLLLLQAQLIFGQLMRTKFPSRRASTLEVSVFVTKYPANKLLDYFFCFCLLVLVLIGERNNVQVMLNTRIWWRDWITLYLIKWEVRLIRSQMLQMMLMGSLGNLNSYNSSGFSFIFQVIMVRRYESNLK